jgi:hypothetical protein
MLAEQLRIFHADDLYLDYHAQLLLGLAVTA